MLRQVTYQICSIPLKKSFSISRGTKTTADVIRLEIKQGENLGRAESVPYQRYGESINSVCEQIDALTNELVNGLNRENLCNLLSAGAARNVIDCALWDLESKIKKTPVWRLLNQSEPRNIETALTLSLDDPCAMTKEAKNLGECSLLKLKLNASNVLESVSAVRKVAPSARIIIDANEAWTIHQLKSYQSELLSMGVDLIEQPLSASDDRYLDDFEHLIPICADESFHTSSDFEKIKGLYDCVNIKLDKTGGLTEAIRCIKKADEQKLKVMVGCMVASSLAMAPAIILTGNNEFIDLDGPFLLASDVTPSLKSGQAKLTYNSELWG